MALVEVFCFWFSVRLGSIIIGIITSLQCCALLTIYGLWMTNPEEYTNKLHLFLDDFLSKQDVAKKLIPDLQVYLTPFAFLISLLLLASLILIFASFKCKPVLIYPFLITYPMYVVLVLVSHIAIMVGLKSQDFGIGDLILYSNVGGFVVLFLLYMWVCVLGFLQILRDLYSQLKEKQKGNRIDLNTVSTTTSTIPYFGQYRP